MQNLSRDAFAELVDLLTPRMETEQERRALLEMALLDAPVLSQIDYSGAAQSFVIRLIKKLKAYGEVEPGKTALWALMEIVYENVGPDNQKRIVDLKDAINASAKAPKVEYQSLPKSQKTSERFMSPTESTVIATLHKAQFLMLFILISMLFVLFFKDDPVQALQKYSLTPFLFGLTTVCIITIFWIRYFVDALRIDRTYNSTLYALLFLYLAAQLANVLSISKPFFWLASVSCVLFLGAGFYKYNLREIKQKYQRGSAGLRWVEYVRWQESRKRELYLLAGLAIVNAFAALWQPNWVPLQSLLALGVGVWQLHHTLFNPSWSLQIP